MIKTEQLIKIYTAEEVETTALNSLNIEIEKGEFVSIMGPSGRRKSTLLNLLGLIDSPTEGKYYFLGQEVAGYKENKRAGLRKSNVGFIFQSFNLTDQLTIFENVELPLLYLGMSSSKRKKRVNEVLDQIKIAYRKKHYCQWQNLISYK